MKLNKLFLAAPFLIVPAFSLSGCASNYVDNIYLKSNDGSTSQESYTFFSNYGLVDGPFRLHAYSDSKCTKEITNKCDWTLVNDSKASLSEIGLTFNTSTQCLEGGVTYSDNVKEGEVFQCMFVATYHTKQYGDIIKHFQLTWCYHEGPSDEGFQYAFFDTIVGIPTKEIQEISLEFDGAASTVGGVYWGAVLDSTGQHLYLPADIDGWVEPDPDYGPAYNLVNNDKSENYFGVLYDMHHNGSILFYCLFSQPEKGKIHFNVPIEGFPPKTIDYEITE